MKNIALAIPLTALAILPSIASADWSGQYAGVTFGTTSEGEIELTDEDPFDSINYNGTGALEDSDTFGAHYGSLSQNNQFVFGGEAEILFAPDAAFTDDIAADGAIIDLKGKAGVAVDRFLAYGVLGVSFIGGTFGANDINAGGLVYGGGVGFMPTDSFVISAEYLSRITSEEFVEATVGFELDTLTLRASYKF